MRDGAIVMHIFTHTFDYIALGILIACMIGAAAVALTRGKFKWPRSSSGQRQATEREGREQ